MIDSVTAASMLNFIEEKCENGAVITIGQDFIEQGGMRLWSIRGAGVDCSGWNTLENCFEKWVDAIEYLEERKEN